MDSINIQMNNYFELQRELILFEVNFCGKDPEKIYETYL